MGVLGILKVLGTEYTERDDKAGAKVYESTGVFRFKLNSIRFNFS